MSNPGEVISRSIYIPIGETITSNCVNLFEQYTLHNITTGKSRLVSRIKMGIVPNGDFKITHNVNEIYDYATSVCLATDDDIQSILSGFDEDDRDLALEIILDKNPRLFHEDEIARIQKIKEGLK